MTEAVLVAFLPRTSHQPAFVVMGRKSRVPRSAMMGVIEAGVAGFMGGLSRPSGSRTPPRLIEGPDTRTVASAGRTFDDPGAGPAS